MYEGESGEAEKIVDGSMPRASRGVNQQPPSVIGDAPYILYFSASRSQDGPRGQAPGHQEAVPPREAEADGGGCNAELLRHHGHGEPQVLDRQPADDGARLCREPPPTPGRQLDRRDSPRAGHAGDDPGELPERVGARGERASGQEAPVHGLDKRPTAEDPFIRQAVLPGAAEGRHGRPGAQAPAEPAALEVRPSAEGHPGRHVVPVLAASGCPAPPEVAQDLLHPLPGAGHPSQDGAMPTPGVPVECRQRWDESGAERIEVDVADQLQEVRILLDQDGLVAVLEEVALPLVAAVEGPGVPGEQPPHAGGERLPARPDKEVDVIGEECPRQDGQPRGRRHGSEPVHPGLAIGLILEYGSALQPSDHDMVEGPRGIQAWAARHGV